MWGTLVAMELPIAISVAELVLIYAIPVAIIFLLWLAISLTVYMAVRSSADFDFKHDLLHKFEAKRKLRSGRDRQLSFLYVTKLLWGDNCIQAALLYRISRYLVHHRMRTLGDMVYAFSRLVTHADVSPFANVGPGLYIYHGVGTVIGKGSHVGERALICQGVAIGGKTTIGDDVQIWPGAKILGEVTVGDRSEVGANAVVIKDVPPDSIVFGIPARLAGRKSGGEGSELEADAAASS
jgi:serine O-acetyltransferase